MIRTQTITKQVVTSDLTGNVLERYIAVDQSLMDGPVRHFKGGPELAAYIILESPSREIILEHLDNRYGIEVRVRDEENQNVGRSPGIEDAWRREECQCQDCRCAE